MFKKSNRAYEIGSVVACILCPPLIPAKLLTDTVLEQKEWDEQVNSFNATVKRNNAYLRIYGIDIPDI